MPRLLSKSKYLYGVQCPKLLWISINDPNRIPEPDPETQHIFDQGHMVGELAKRLFPGGTDVPDDDFSENLRETRELLKRRVTLFEAGMLAGPFYSRLDVLTPVGTSEWDIVEVKSSTSVKAVNLHDVSFQKLVCEMAGLKVRKCFLAHINNEYVRQGEIVPEELLTVEDVTEPAVNTAAGIQARVNSMLQVIESPSCPDCAIGPHCRDPYECAFEECWAEVPEDSVFTLYHGGKKSFDLFRNGIVRVKDIPATYSLSNEQRIQRSCEIKGTPHVDRDSIRKFVFNLEYPRYFLDFETFSSAVPLFNGSRPYQNVPFQFSLHVKEDESSHAKHYSYLADGGSDPRSGLLARLVQVLGDSGPIITYNKSFEQSILDELGDTFPEYSAWAQKVTSRLVDLLTPFRNFHYYHPAQRGSASMKSVLPALTGRGYKGMDIANGEDASLAFMRMMSGGLSPGELKEIRDNLEKYCGLDTQGMIWIVDKLSEECHE